jgi:hypothetical protein
MPSAWRSGCARQLWMMYSSTAHVRMGDACTASASGLWTPRARMLWSPDWRAWVFAP